MERSVLFTFILLANVHTPGLVSHEHGFEYRQAEGQAIRFIPNGADPLGDLKEMYRADIVDLPVGSKEGSLSRRALDHLLETMIVPEVEIEFGNVRIDKEEMPSENGSLETTADKLSQTTWATLLREAITCFNSLIRDLYVHHQDSRILSSMFFTSGDIARDLNECKARIRQPDGSILRIQFNAQLNSSSNSIGEITLDEAEIDNLRSGSLTNTENQVIWDYLVSAERRFNDGSYRHAIIDMDIAAGIAVRHRLMDILGLSQQKFLSLSKKSSSGELIKSLALVSSHDHDSPITALESLHSTRNTILHRNQRRVSKETVSHYKVVRDWILRLFVFH